MIHSCLQRCSAAGLPLRAQETDLERKLSDKIAEALKKSGAPSASIAVVQDGRLAFVKAFGANEITNRQLLSHTSG
jgi:CubicO group peptidase (beta-lactamase class C family)